MPDWLQMFLRSILMVFLLFFLMKGFGKNRLNQLSPFDYLSGFVLSGIIAVLIFDLKIPLFVGFLVAIVWFLVPYFVRILSLKSKRFRDFTQGKSTVVIKEGKILEDNLKKERYSTDDLLYHLREQHIFRAADVEFALIEPTGKITAIPKSEHQSITKKDLNMKTAPQSEIYTVIMDGEILIEPLGEQGKNPAWLKTELEKMNVTKENVFLGQLDDDGQLTIDLYDDKLTASSPTEKPLLLATLKKASADLQLFALATDNPASKQLYERNHQKMEQVIKKIAPYLQA